MSGPLLQGWGGGHAPFLKEMPTSLHGRPGAAGGASALQPLLKPCLLVAPGPMWVTGLPTPRSQADEGRELRLRGDPRGEVPSAGHHLSGSAGLGETWPSYSALGKVAGSRSGTEEGSETEWGDVGPPGLRSETAQPAPPWLASQHRHFPGPRASEWGLRCRAGCVATCVDVMGGGSGQPVGAGPGVLSSAEKCSDILRDAQLDVEATEEP